MILLFVCVITWILLVIIFRIINFSVVMNRLWHWARNLQAAFGSKMRTQSLTWNSLGSDDQSYANFCAPYACSMCWWTIGISSSIYCYISDIFDHRPVQGLLFFPMRSLTHSTIPSSSKRWTGWMTKSRSEGMFYFHSFSSTQTVFFWVNTVWYPAQSNVPICLDWPSWLIQITWF